jgi:hypothetical protein
MDTSLSKLLDEYDILGKHLFPEPEIEFPEQRLAADIDREIREIEESIEELKLSDMNVKRKSE